MLKVMVSILLSFSLLSGQSQIFSQKSFTSNSEQESNSFDLFEDEFSEESINPSWDPLETYNIKMTKFNDFIYVYAVRYIATGYGYIAPKPIRVGIYNAFENIRFPIRFINNILQLKFHHAFNESARFIINSTYGLAGFIDIARSEGGLEPHDEDFGQTLGFYGAGDNVHIVLPLFGPYNFRDIVGLIGDGFIDPIYYAQKREKNIFTNNNTYLFINTYRTGNEYSLYIDVYENIRKDSINLYLLLKTAYEQNRDKEIKE
ncbi:MAG: VacJ family lipoprotein [Sulfurospirillum sp.]|nr:VacJ family lipoprotein [Sulfurospirillum sp.]